MAVVMEFLKSCFEESGGKTDFEKKSKSLRNQIWIGLSINTNEVDSVINELSVVSKFYYKHVKTEYQ